jgi:hypothetical protein
MLVATGFTLGLPSAANHHTMFQMKRSRKCRTSNWLWTIWRISFDGRSCWLRTQLLCGKSPLIIFTVTMKKSFTDCHRSAQEMIQIVLGNVFTISLLTFLVMKHTLHLLYSAMCSPQKLSEAANAPKLNKEVHVTHLRMLA